MTDPQALRDLAEIREVAGELNPSATLGKIADGLRGGLPAQSMSDGRGGGESAGGFDKHDGWLRGQRKAYNRLLADARNALKRARVIETTLEPAKDVVPDPECANQAFGCENVVTDARHSECARCRQHRHRHGKPWPDKTSNDMLVSDRPAV